MFFEKRKNSSLIEARFGINYDGSINRSSVASPNIFRGIFDWAKFTFLPLGFPNSVKKEYLEYQLYDTLQALCSYFRSVLCTKALLTGAGVGSAEASALAAAITWVLRYLHYFSNIEIFLI